MKLNRAAIRFRDLQTVIGQELRAHYELPCELPHQLLTLLMQLNAQQNELLRPHQSASLFPRSFAPLSQGELFSHLYNESYTAIMRT
jgi:hypothetical protein